MNRPDRKLRVGVTIHLRKGQQSIWENGIFQNCVFLVQLFNQSPAVEQAVLVNGGDSQVASDAMLLQHAGINVIDLDQAMQTLDVVIEMSALLPDEWVQSFRQRGGRYAWMRVGNDYVIDIERAMFDKPSGALCSAKTYDAVWTIPEYEHSCGDYFALTTRAPVRILPHLWTPLFFQQGINTLPKGTPYGYQPGRARWRVCAFEPNVCMVKTSLIPMLVCEEAYRAQPAFLEALRVCNTMHIKDHATFLHFARRLDVVNHGLATFEGRFPVYQYMAERGDCIISHHWENGQNYLYYEALYGGYPLIHNSEFIKDCGYYYPEFDCQEGGRALLRAFAEHDRQLKDYKSQANRALRRLDIDHPENIEIYTRELLRLYGPV
jgi:hypothetical protein